VRVRRVGMQPPSPRRPLWASQVGPSTCSLLSASPASIRNEATCRTAGVPARVAAARACAASAWCGRVRSAEGAAMISKGRLTGRMRGRLGFRLRGRLRFPRRFAKLPGLRCKLAGFRASYDCDISTSASKSCDPRPLTRAPLRVVLLLSPRAARVSRRRPCPRRVPAAGRCARSPKGTLRRAQPHAYRVVAGRRRLSSSARLDPCDSAGGPAIAGKGCTALPSLSRRSACRFANCPAARRRRGGGR
jgi:hypothetical protein